MIHFPLFFLAAELIILSMIKTNSNLLFQIIKLHME